MTELLKYLADDLVVNDDHPMDVTIVYVDEDDDLLEVLHLPLVTSIAMDALTAVDDELGFPEQEDYDGGVSGRMWSDGRKGVAILIGDVDPDELKSFDSIFAAAKRDAINQARATMKGTGG